MWLGCAHLSPLLCPLASDDDHSEGEDALSEGLIWYVLVPTGNSLPELQRVLTLITFTAMMIYTHLFLTGEMTTPHGQPTWKEWISIAMRQPGAQRLRRDRGKRGHCGFIDWATNRAVKLTCTTCRRSRRAGRYSNSS